ncbi:MAG: DUF721 domain-containing protein [Alphaproteobacteria bacterium]|nr:DUF721 domain-containing protein [Alphaproteobacteria bacterium]
MGETNRRREDASNTATLKGRPAESERGHGFRTVGVAVSKLAAPVVAKRGGGILVRLKAHWAMIVGPDWACVTWPTGLGRDGALKLCAASGAALELQHCAPLLIERINLFFGRSVISRLALVQGLPAPASSPAGLPPRRLAPAEERVLDEQLAVIAEPQLREALARLGEAVFSSED